MHGPHHDLHEPQPAPPVGDIVPAEGGGAPDHGPAADQLPAEPPAPEILDPAAEGEDQQWNPMEWDRAAEELTWERLLGGLLL